MGMGSCVSQVCMGTQRPLDMRAYHQWAGLLHGRPGPCAHDEAWAHMVNPGGSMHAWSSPCPAPTVVKGCAGDTAAKLGQLLFSCKDMVSESVGA